MLHKSVSLLSREQLKNSSILSRSILASLALASMPVNSAYAGIHAAPAGAPPTIGTTGDVQVDTGSISVATGVLNHATVHVISVPTNAVTAGLASHVPSLTSSQAGLGSIVAPGTGDSNLIQGTLHRVTVDKKEITAIDLNGDGLISFATTKTRGTVPVEGAPVLITASAANNVLNNTINTNGIPEATTAHSNGNTLVLGGGGSHQGDGEKSHGSSCGNGVITCVKISGVNAPANPVQVPPACGGNVGVSCIPIGGGGKGGDGTHHGENPQSPPGGPTPPSPPNTDITALNELQQDRTDLFRKDYYAESLAIERLNLKGTNTAEGGPAQRGYVELSSLNLSLLGTAGTARPTVTNVASNVAPGDLGNLAPAAGGNLGNLSPSAGGDALTNSANTFLDSGYRQAQ
jgi:hypothetical protein